MDVFKLQKFVRIIFIGLSSLLLVAASASLFKASALTIDSARDCDNNAVLRCGAMTPNEVKKKYYDQEGARTIFHHFGITHNDIDALSHSTAVEGKVTKGGRVLVDGKEVATGVVTAGRQSMPGSTKVTANGLTFYKRPPDVSFTSSSLPAFVVMKNGQFDFAIIASCGNPVIGKEKSPTPAPQPTPPQPPQPAPTPQPTPSASATATASTTVIVQKEPTPTPAPQPTPPQPPQPQSKTLPKTGADQAFMLAGVLTFGTTLSHLIYSNRKFFFG